MRGVIKRFRYLTEGELIGRQGKHLVSIPLPQIEIPRFRFNWKDAGGVGQGDGDAGDPLDGAPGTAPGQHLLEVEVNLEELAEILGEELELPRIQPRGRRTLPSSAPGTRTSVGRAPRAFATSSARSANP